MIYEWYYWKLISAVMYKYPGPLSMEEFCEPFKKNWILETK